MEWIQTFQGVRVGTIGKITMRQEEANQLMKEKTQTKNEYVFEVKWKEHLDNWVKNYWKIWPTIYLDMIL